MFYYLEVSGIHKSYDPTFGLMIGIDLPAWYTMGWKIIPQRIGNELWIGPVVIKNIILHKRMQ